MPGPMFGFGGGGFSFSPVDMSGGNGLPQEALDYLGNLTGMNMNDPFGIGAITDMVQSSLQDALGLDPSNPRKKKQWQGSLTQQLMSSLFGGGGGNSPVAEVAHLGLEG